MIDHTIGTVAEFFRHYEEAAWAKNANRMVELYDDDIVVFDMWEKDSSAVAKNGPV